MKVPAQAVGPVYPVPPHCPHWLCAGPEAVVVGEGADVVTGLLVAGGAAVVPGPEGAEGADGDDPSPMVVVIGPCSI